MALQESNTQEPIIDGDKISLQTQQSDIIW